MQENMFDHTRMQEEWLSAKDKTPREKAKFGKLAEDYINYLRLYEPSDGSGDATVEQTTLQRFLTCLDDDILWDVARQRVVEFREPSTDSILQGSPLHQVLTHIQDRNPYPDALTKAQIEERDEERFMWEHTVRRLRYLMLEAQTFADEADKVKKEMEDLTNEMSLILKKVAPAEKFIRLIQKFLYGTEGHKGSDREWREKVQHVKDIFEEAIIRRASPLHSSKPTTSKTGKQGNSGQPRSKKDVKGKGKQKEDEYEEEEDQEKGYADEDGDMYGA